jgi:hypothetical protein
MNLQYSSHALVFLRFGITSDVEDVGATGDAAGGFINSGGVRVKLAGTVGVIIGIGWPKVNDMIPWAASAWI